MRLLHPYRWSYAASKAKLRGWKLGKFVCVFARDAVELVVESAIDAKYIFFLTDYKIRSISTLKMDSIEVHSSLDSVDRDIRHRFDNVSRVFKVFSNSLKIGTPPSVEEGFRGSAE